MGKKSGKKEAVVKPSPAKNPKSISKQAPSAVQKPQAKRQPKQPNNGAVVKDKKGDKKQQKQQKQSDKASKKSKKVEPIEEVTSSAEEEEEEVSNGDSSDESDAEQAVPVRGPAAEDDDSDEDDSEEEVTEIATNGAVDSDEDESDSEEESEGNEEEQEEEQEASEGEEEDDDDEQEEEEGGSEQESKKRKAQDIDDSSRKVYLSNLSWNVNEAWLKKEFGECGAIKDVILMRDHQKRSKGAGFIEFEDAKSAAAAMKLDGKEIDGRNVNVGNVNPRSKRQHDDQVSPKTNTLFVANLSWNTTEDTLHEVFGEYGDLRSVRLITEAGTGRSKGFAYIEYSSVEQAASALSMKGCEVDGREIRVDFASPRDENKPRSNFGGQPRGRGGRGGGFQHRGGFRGGSNRGRGGRGGRGWS